MFERRDLGYVPVPPANTSPLQASRTLFVKLPGLWVQQSEASSLLSRAHPTHLGGWFLSSIILPPDPQRGHSWQLLTFEQPLGGRKFSGQFKSTGSLHKADGQRFNFLPPTPSSGCTQPGPCGRCAFLLLLLFFFNIYFGWHQVLVAAHGILLVARRLLSRCGWRLGLVVPRHATRDGTCVPCIERQILNHWTSREVLFLKSPLCFQLGSPENG